MTASLRELDEAYGSYDWHQSIGFWVTDAVCELVDREP